MKKTHDFFLTSECFDFGTELSRISIGTKDEIIDVNHMIS